MDSFGAEYIKELPLYNESQVWNYMLNLFPLVGMSHWESCITALSTRPCTNTILPMQNLHFSLFILLFKRFLTLIFNSVYPLLVKWFICILFGRTIIQRPFMTIKYKEKKNKYIWVSYKHNEINLEIIYLIQINKFFSFYFLIFYLP